MSAIKIVVREIVENDRNTISNFTNEAFDDEVSNTREKKSERSLFQICNYFERSK